MSELASREKILQIIRQEDPELIASLILNMQAHIKSQSEQNGLVPVTVRV